MFCCNHSILHRSRAHTDQEVGITVPNDSCDHCEESCYLQQVVGCLSLQIAHAGTNGSLLLVSSLHNGTSLKLAEREISY